MVEFKLKPGSQVYCYNDGTWQQAGPSAAGLVLRGKQAASTIDGLPPGPRQDEMRNYGKLFFHTFHFPS
jgi:hypothetical protein